MERYAFIERGRPREIVLLVGYGCAYKKCAFCDYHKDCSPDGASNFALNSAVLARVTGRTGELEVINSGSVFELDRGTLNLIAETCRARSIGTVHFEAHYMYRDRLDEIRALFDGVRVIFKLGLETFDFELRENVLKKGINECDPEVICRGFGEANFLFGIKGQSVQSMKSDIELGLKYFNRICVNIMCKNSTAILPDSTVIDGFMREVFPLYRDNDRVDILVNNTDFGVGE